VSLGCPYRHYTLPDPTIDNNIVVCFVWYKYVRVVDLTRFEALTYSMLLPLPEAFMYNKYI
jgi:hypothetical protein